MIPKGYGALFIKFAGIGDFGKLLIDGFDQTWCTEIFSEQRRHAQTLVRS